MTANPLIVIAVLLLVVALCFVFAATLARRSWRKSHPTIRTRRKELERAVMMDEITDDEYADKTIALDYEETRARTRRRL